MYALRPMKVYAMERVKDDPRCVARMERILGGLGNHPELMWITDESLPEAVSELQAMWPPPEQGNGTPESYRRPLVFTTMDLSYKRADLRPLVERCPEGTSLGTLTSIHGYMTTAIDQHP
jgi:hypothetical protein